MLQAVYKTSPYTFYLSTEDKRIDTSKTDTDNLVYLFKLTNDMLGEVQFAYGHSQVIDNRYSKFLLYHNTTPLYYAARVNLVPNGYWSYELYEYSGDTTVGTSCQTVPDPATDNIGVYTIKDNAGVQLRTGYVNTYGLYDKSIGIPYTNYADHTYQIVDLCGTVINTLTFPVGNFLAATSQFNDKHPLKFDNVVQTSTGITFDIVSNMPVGYHYTLQQGSGAITTITPSVQPQTNSFTYSQIGQPDLAANKIAVTMYDATPTPSAYYAGYAYPITYPSTYYGYVMPIAVTPALISFPPPIGVDLNGKVFYSAMYNGVAGSISSTQKYYSLQGLTTQGKLYVSETSGEEQVQYTEHTEPSGTNYIYTE